MRAPVGGFVKQYNVVVDPNRLRAQGISLKALRDAIRSWAESEIAPNAAKCDEDAEFPKASWEAYASSPFIGMQYPAEFGGDGADGVEERKIVLAVERNTKELEPLINDGDSN